MPKTRYSAADIQGMNRHELLKLIRSKELSYSEVDDALEKSKEYSILDWLGDKLADDDLNESSKKTKFVAVDPTSGRHLRPASEDEAEAYMNQKITKPSISGIPSWLTWGKPVRVGNVLVDVDKGPGQSHIPNRFSESTVKFVGHKRGMMSVPGYKEVEKNWHKATDEAVRALNNVSLPHGGEWGLVVSVKDWHAQAYEKAIDALEDAKKISGGSLLQKVEDTISKFKEIKRKVEDVVRKHSGEMNRTNSEGFIKVQDLHAEAKNALGKMFSARYEESVTKPQVGSYCKIALGYFQEDSSWRDKVVKNHRTGNMVKVSSLPPEEQDRYKPKAQGKIAGTNVAQSKTAKMHRALSNDYREKGDIKKADWHMQRAIADEQGALKKKLTKGYEAPNEAAKKAFDDMATQSGLKGWDLKKVGKNHVLVGEGGKEVDLGPKATFPKLQREIERLAGKYMGESVEQKSKKIPFTLLEHEIVARTNQAKLVLHVEIDMDKVREESRHVSEEELISDAESAIKRISIRDLSFDKDNLRFGMNNPLLKFKVTQDGKEIDLADTEFEYAGGEVVPVENSRYEIKS